MNWHMYDEQETGDSFDLDIRLTSSYRSQAKVLLSETNTDCLSNCASCPDTCDSCLNTCNSCNTCTNFCPLC